MGELNYQLRILTDEALKDVEKSKSVFKRITDNAVSGGEAIDAAYTEAAKKIEQAFEDLNEAGEKTRVEIKRLSASLKEYEQAAGDAFMRGDDATFRAMNEKIAGVQSAIRDANSNIKAIDETTFALEKQRQELDADYKAAKKQADAQTSMRTQMRKLREELIAMEQSGKRNTAEYREMQQQLGKLTDAYGDAARQAQVFAHDNANLQGVISGLSGLAGAFSVGQGAIGMFAGESENLTKVLTRVQSIMAVTNGLQTVANTLNKDSAFRLTTVAKAQELWSKGIKNTGTALVKMGMSANAARTAAIALQSAMTLGIGAAIAGAIALITKLVNKWKEAKEVQEAFNSEVAKNAAKPIAAFQEMAYQWNQLDMEGKEKFVRDNAKAFDELGVSVKNVADAENLLVENADAFMSAQLAKAKSAAATKLAQDKAEDYVKKSMQYEQIGTKVTADTRKFWEQQIEYLQNLISTQGDSMGILGDQVKDYEDKLKKFQIGDRALSQGEERIKNKLKKELEDINADIKEFYESARKDSEAAAEELKKAKIKSNEIEEGTVAWYEQKISNLNGELKKLSDTTGTEAKKIKDEIAKNQAEIDKILANNKEQKTSSGRDWLTEQMAQAKSQYALVASMMSSTDELTRKHGEELYEELKKNGVDYLDFLIKLREQYKGKLSDSQSIAIDAAIADLTKKQQKDDEKQAQSDLDRLMEQYKTYERQANELKLQYQKDLKTLLDAGKYEEAKMLTDAYTKAMDDLDEKFGKSMLKLSPQLAKAMESAANKTKKSLKESITLIEKVRDYKQGKGNLDGTGVTPEQAEKLTLEELKDLYQQLNELQDEYDKRTQYPFKNLIDGIKKLKQARKELNEGDKEKSGRLRAMGLAEIEKAAGNAAQAISMVSDTMSKLSETVSDQQLANRLKATSESLSFLASVGSGFASSGLWGAVAGGVSSIVSEISNDAVESAQKEALAKSQLVSYQAKYNELLAERNYLEKDYSGIMGADNLGRAQAAFEQYNKSLSNYNELVKKKNQYEGDGVDSMEMLGAGNVLEGIFKNVKVDSDNQLLRLGLMGATGLWWNNTSTYEKDLKNARDRGLNNLQSQMIQRQERKWFKIGSKDRYTTLFDMAPEIWGGDINGDFDVEAARAFLETHTDVSDELKANVEAAITAQEEYDKALETTKQIAQDIIGDISGNMANSIVNAVETGADAWNDFEASGANAIKNLGKEMVQSLIYNNFMKKYEEEVTEAIGSGDNEGLMDIIGRIGQEMPTMYEAGKELLKTVYDKGEELGYQMYNIEQQNREASAKGIAQASQDSIDELNGRMTAVQGHTFAISQNTATLTQHTAQMLRLLTGISGDTARLENIEARMNSMDYTLSNINDRGVIVRQ